MSLTPALRSITSTLPSIGLTVGSLVALVASFSLSGWSWLGSLVSAGVLLWLRYHLEGREKDKQRQHEASEHEKDRQQEAQKWQQEAQEREKDREHEVKKWKHDKEVARINAPASTSSTSSVMAVA